MYEDMTFDIIMQRMLARIPDDMDRREGSVIWDAMAPAAAELELAYLELDNMLNEAFADTASRDFLIRRCAERGITVLPATYAIVKGEFLPIDLDVLGKRFNYDDLNFVATEKIADGVYKLQCESPGVDGNRAFGNLIPIEYIPGLTSVLITELLIPGEDEEDTEALRDRYYQSFEDKAFGGNKQDYLDKTNAISGVGATKVTRIWDGPGTVKLTIIDSLYDKASVVLIQAVQDIIDPLQDAKGDGLAPVGHIVTVDTVQDVTVDIATVIEFDSGITFEAKAAEIEAAMELYLLELRQDWANQANLIVRIAHIETRILAITGIADIRDTKINGVASNLTLDGHQVPVLGVITNGP